MTGITHPSLYKLTEEKKASLLAEYIEGANTRDLAKRYGVDPSYPTILASRNFIKLRLPADWRRNQSEGARNRRQR